MKKKSHSDQNQQRKVIPEERGDVEESGDRKFKEEVFKWRIKMKLKSVLVVGKKKKVLRKPMSCYFNEVEKRKIYSD